MSESEKTHSSFFGPLSFPDHKQGASKNWAPICTDCTCLLCEQIFTLPLQEQMMLTHFFTDHRLVLADAHIIANLKSYVEYWKEGFKGYDLAEFCSTMLLDQTPDGKYSKNEKYYLLSEVLPKDNELRMRLRREKLETILTQHQMERTSTDYERECLFCRQVLKGTRSEFLKHLYEKHNLFLGKPNNLVYIDDMINTIHEKMERLECLFCDKVFKDRNMLKEHMRKKSHKRINPDNKLFDRFYLINYTDPGKHIPKTKHKHPRPADAVRKQSNKSTNSNSDTDSDWSDWEGDSPNITCLYCSHTDTQYNNLLAHMKNLHQFDFADIIKDLDFYQKVKLVNYTRRQMHVLQCVTCCEDYKTQEELVAHMKKENHYTVEKQEAWDQPEFFFPTYEDDNFLCYLENDSQVWIEPETSDDGALAGDASTLSLQSNE